MIWKIRPDAAAIEKDEKTRKSLRRYFSVFNDEKPAKFLIAKKLPAAFSQGGSLEKLWQEHARLAEKFLVLEEQIGSQKASLSKLPEPEKSCLDLKIQISKRILASCHLCNRSCRVNRLENKQGYCGCGLKIAVSSIFAHMGEEPELVPSGTIFTMGCTMRCKHCQNWTISQWEEKERFFTSQDLAREIEQLRCDGCRNINLVGGEPTPWLAQWLDAFKLVNANVPVVWNSNSYYSEETAGLLAGFADVYLLDFKYGPGECAERISDAPDYWRVCTRNHTEAKKSGEVIVRVLVLPGHLDCCTRPILEWIARNLGVETRVNVMFQFRPEWRAHDVPELRRRLSRDEMDQAIRIAKDSGLVNFMT